jgi:hypothetical protein
VHVRAPGSEGLPLARVLERRAAHAADLGKTESRHLFAEPEEEQQAPVEGGDCGGGGVGAAVSTQLGA